MADISKLSMLLDDLPDLVDAVSPGGRGIDADRLAQELADASAYDDLSAQAFGSRTF
jgi:hypothetical protein